MHLPHVQTEMSHKHACPQHDFAKPQRRRGKKNSLPQVTSYHLLLQEEQPGQFSSPHTRRISLGGLLHCHSPFPPARFQTHHRKAESFQPLRSLVVKDTVCGTVHSNNNVILLAPGMVARRGLLEYHRHHRHILFHLTTQPEKGEQNYENTPERATDCSLSTPVNHSFFQHLLVFFQGFGYIEVGHHITSDKDEVGTNKGLGIHVSQHVTKGAVQVRGDKAHRVGRRVLAPLGFPARRKKNIRKA